MGMAGRVIAIGDVHGCWRELDQLLEYLSPASDDRLIMLGDLVNRGPDSHRVIEICRRANAISLLGNHERRLLNYRWLQDPSVLWVSDKKTIDQLSEPDWDYLAKMKLTHYEEDYQTVFVHAGFLPGRDWRTQTSSIVTEIQVVDKEGQARRRSEVKGCPHWSELWEGPPFVVYGHTPAKAVRKTDWTICLDTGCVYGGNLTAYVLPQKQLYQVKAARQYYEKSLS